MEIVNSIFEAGGVEFTFTNNKQEKNTKKWKKCLTNEDECGILLSVAENESCENNKLEKVVDRHEMMWYTLKVAAEKLQQKSLKSAWQEQRVMITYTSCHLNSKAKNLDKWTMYPTLKILLKIFRNEQKP